jgi:hypothetical protein
VASVRNVTHSFLTGSRDPAEARKQESMPTKNDIVALRDAYQAATQAAIIAIQAHAADRTNDALRATADVATVLQVIALERLERARGVAASMRRTAA